MRIPTTFLGFCRGWFNTGAGRYLEEFMTFDAAARTSRIDVKPGITSGACQSGRLTGRWKKGTFAVGAYH